MEKNEKNRETQLVFALESSLPTDSFSACCHLSMPMCGVDLCERASIPKSTCCAFSSRCCHSSFSDGSSESGGCALSVSCLRLQSQSRVAAAAENDSSRVLFLFPWSLREISATILSVRGCAGTRFCSVDGGSAQQWRAVLGMPPSRVTYVSSE